ncbi:MAG TPA: FAD-dependent oxidoreductase, partial [Ktedonobacterales bacterium]|nr:FAD-dependent oxidoreductase [Ktedonobacterales bacterium]
MANQVYHNTLGRHALVIGGSMAGLLAARVLLDYFDRVTIIDRDRFPADPVFRPGTPQARHVHIFLARGQQELERLFPGIGAKMIAHGAPCIDLIDDAQYYIGESAAARFPSDLRLYLSTRPLLEWMVRSELRRRQELTLCEGAEAVELLADGNGHVTGVRVRQRTGSADAPTEDLAADLVVDASGRESPAPRWLSALGYTPPEETAINAFLGYASRIYARPANHEQMHNWKVLFIPAQAPQILRGGVIWPIENDQWIVTLAGSGRDYPPTDEAGFLDFARGMRHQGIYETLKDAKPLTPIYGYRRTENRRRH